MPLRKAIISFLVFIIFTEARPQSDSLSWEEQFALLELEMDRHTLFSMVDSMLDIKPTIFSEWSIRTSYNSNLLSAGRDYGIKQHSISPGISYYHKSGLYADLSGFWNSAFSPQYHLSISSVGYIGALGKKWNYSGSYDRWFFTEKDTTDQLKNNFNISATYNSKYFFTSLDYTAMFGKAGFTQRLIGTVSGNLKFKNVPFFDQIQLLPSFSVIYGNNEVIRQFTPDQTYYQQLREALSDDETREYIWSKLTRSDLQKIQSIRQSESLNKREKLYARLEVYKANEELSAFIDTVLDDITSSFYKTTNEYGIMNYSLSLPVLFKKDNFTIMLGYLYSIPVALPGEESISPSGYFSASVSHRIPVR